MTDKYRVPFNRPYLAGKELNYISEAVHNGWIAGDGVFTKRCQRFLEQNLGAPRVFLTTSCTDALEMSALLLELGPGDEVIVPSFTFVTTANAYCLHGATPVFIDVRSDTLNLDERRLAESITEKTKAIIPVHYAGIGCNMKAIMEIADQNGVAVVEDNAHGLFASYCGQPLGTFGKMATLSFHETKNISSGEGGALIINDPAMIEHAEIVWQKGTNRSRFLRGQVDKYTWVDLGSSYLPSDIIAAYLMAQLEAWEEIQAKRKAIWDRYHAELQGWGEAQGIRLPYLPEGCTEQAYHMYYIIMPSLKRRGELISFLKDHGINAIFHYQPLHLSDMGRKFGGRVGDCPVTEDLSDRLLRLPFYNELDEADQSYVIETLFKFN